MEKKAQALLEKIHQRIDGAVDGFNESVPQLQRSIFERLQVLIKDLELSNGRLANTVDNIKKIGQLKGEIERIVLDKKYISQVGDFTKAFDVVSELQNKYFSLLANDFKPNKLLNAIKQDAITSTVSRLTESGLNANVIQGVEDILRTNIRIGGKYADFVEQLRNHINPEGGQGALQGYIKTITTDSINTYNRTYSNVIAADLGLSWGRFTGSLRTSSRPICIAMAKLQYFHKSQIPELLNGVVDGKQTPLGSNGLPLGMKEETTVENYAELLNGWNCAHAWSWVSEGMVPKEIVAKVKPSAVLT